MQDDIAAALAEIREYAEAPAPTPGVVEVVAAKLEYLTERVPDGELQQLSNVVARQVAEVHEPDAPPSVSKHLRLVAALARLETRLTKLTSQSPRG